MMFLRSFVLRLSLLFIGASFLVQADTKAMPNWPDLNAIVAGRLSESELPRVISSFQRNSPLILTHGGKTIVEWVAAHGKQQLAADVASYFLDRGSFQAIAAGPAWILQRDPRVPVIRFYHPGQDFWGQLFSNYSQHRVTLPAGTIPGTPMTLSRSLTFTTSEHAFQAMKILFVTQDENHADIQRIVASTNPDDAKTIASPYNSAAVSRGWHNAVKNNVMIFILEQKVAQNPMVRLALQMTGKAVLLENTVAHDDKEWGIGTNGDGKNMLGIDLMSIRDHLLTSTVVPVSVVPASVQVPADKGFCCIQ